MERKRPFLKWISRIFLFTFVFLLGFALARQHIGPGIRKNTVAIIKINGIIKDSWPVIKKLRFIKDNSNIKAVVIRLNSPGGAVGPSQEIYMELMRLRKQKPVVASLGTIAASGAYYIASAATKIVADPGTLTGSIGVKIELANVKKLLDKLGIEPMVLKSVPYKDIGSPFRKMTPQEEALLNKLLDDVQKQFVEAVARGRHLPLKKVESIADGSVFTGRQAQRLGLVDKLGNIEDAINLAAQMAGIKGKPHLYFPKEKTSLTRMLLNNLAEVLMEQIQKMKISY